MQDLPAQYETHNARHEDLSGHRRVGTPQLTSLHLFLKVVLQELGRLPIAGETHRRYARIVDRLRQEDTQELDELLALHNVQHLKKQRAYQLLGWKCQRLRR